ncbi:MAG: PEP-CTERM sorting domain-containing protein [Planctomycetia bacterium]|nr:PEP-CTERM sorting domain-containing protein [Planctomycetia bacterium]
MRRLCFHLGVFSFWLFFTSAVVLAQGHTYYWSSQNSTGNWNSKNWVEDSLSSEEYIPNNAQQAYILWGTVTSSTDETGYFSGVKNIQIGGHQVGPDVYDPATLNGYFTADTVVSGQTITIAQNGTFNITNGVSDYVNASMIVETDGTIKNDYFGALNLGQTDTQVKGGTVNFSSLNLGTGETTVETSKYTQTGGTLALNGTHLGLNNAAFNISGGEASISPAISLSGGAQLNISQSATETPTTFNVTTTSNIVTLSDKSEINVSGGTANIKNAIALIDSSKLNVSGGAVTFDGNGVWKSSSSLSDTSEINVSGGKLDIKASQYAANGASYTTLKGTSKVTVSGDGEFSIDTIIFDDNSSLSMTGGTFNATGNFTLNSSATLSPYYHSADVNSITIGGTATLNGTIDFTSFIEAIENPVSGNSYNFLTASTITGTPKISGLSSGWALNQSDTAYSLTYSGETPSAYVWTGATDTTYQTPGNWNVGDTPATDPINGKTLYVRSTTAPVVMGGNVLGASLTIGGGEAGETAEVSAAGITQEAPVTIAAGGTFNGTGIYTLTSTLTVEDGGTWSCTNFVNIGHTDADATLNITGGIFNANGVYEGDSIRIGRPASSPGQGIVNVSGGVLNSKNGITLGFKAAAEGKESSMTVSGTATVNVGTEDTKANGNLKVDNKATLTLSDTARINTTNEFILTNGTFNMESGTLNTPTFRHTGGTFNFTGGKLQTANFEGNLTQASTTFLTGYNEKGGITISGNYTLENGALLISAGLVAVDGDATLAGTIDVASFIEAITPISGNSYNFLTASTITGNPTISGLSSGWALNQSATAYSLTYSGGSVSTDYYWSPEGTDNTYNTPNNWVLGEGGTTRATDALTDKNLFVQSTTTDLPLGSNSIQGKSLTIGGGAGGQTAKVTAGTVNLAGDMNILTGGTFAPTGTMYIGAENAPATVTVDGGELSIGSDLTLGTYSGGAGKLVLTNGTVKISGSAWIGEGNSDGTLEITGGELTAAGFQVGQKKSGGGKATITISGGKLSSTGNFVLGDGPVDAGDESEMTISGEALVTVGGRMDVARKATLNMEGGTLNATSQLYLGVGTSGTINHSAGEITVNNQFAIGWGDGAGFYNLSGGTLNTEASASLWCGSNSDGEAIFNMTGGTANFKGDFTHTISSGNVYSGNSFVIGAGANNTVGTIFNLNAGEMNVTNNLMIDRSGILNIAKLADGTLGTGVLKVGGEIRVANGTMNLSDGTVEAKKLEVGFSMPGSFSMSGGEMTVENDVVVGDWATNENATSTFNVSDGEMNIGGKLRASNNANATMEISGGKVTATGIELGMNKDTHVRTATFTLSGGEVSLGEGGFSSTTGLYTLNLTGGTLKTNGADWSSSLDANFTTKGAVVNFAPEAGRKITWSGKLSGLGGLTVGGEGTVVLQGEHDYTGPTTVASGAQLQIASDASLASAISVEGTIFGNGRIGAMDLKENGDFYVNLDQWLNLGTDEQYSKALTVINGINFDDLSSVVFESKNPASLLGQTLYFLVDSEGTLDEIKFAEIYDFILAGGADLWSFGSDALGTGKALWVQFNGGDVAVPEPSTWGIMILGLLALGYCRARRVKK